MSRLAASLGRRGSSNSGISAAARARANRHGADLRADGELYALDEIVDKLQRLSRTLTQRAVLA